MALNVVILVMRPLKTGHGVLEVRGFSGALNRRGAPSAERNLNERGRSVPHSQAFNDFAFEYVVFQDFRHILVSLDLVPDAFRIDHHRWPTMTLVEAPRSVGPHFPFQSQPLQFRFEKFAQAFAAFVRATSFGMIGRSSVEANENVMIKLRHAMGDSVLKEERPDRSLSMGSD